MALYVLIVLHTKHMYAHLPTVASLYMYPYHPPELFHVDITDKTVTGVAGRFSGGAGLGGADSVILQHWILRFGAASEKLRLIVAYFAEWLGNGRPLWSAYRALISGLLLTLDNHPGVRPGRVVETWQRLMVKC